MVWVHYLANGLEKVAVGDVIDEGQSIRVVTADTNSFNHKQICINKVLVVSIKDKNL